MNHIELAKEILADQKELEQLRNRVLFLERAIKLSLIKNMEMTFASVGYKTSDDQYASVDKLRIWEGTWRWRLLDEEGEFIVFKETV